MTEDWAAVAEAISERMEQLGMNQHMLARRAQVSTAMVIEIQGDRVRRRRHPRTLRALSVALGWHPDHLSVILAGVDPASLAVDRTADVHGRLTELEHRLRAICDEIAALNVGLDIAEFSHEF